MSHFETYERILSDATKAAEAEISFWRSLVSAHRAERLDIEDIRQLIAYASIIGARPSRATAYRQLELWAGRFRDLDNNGRGA